MENLPPTETARPTLPRHRPAARWPWYVGGIVLATGAAVWVGEVPNRYKASQLGKHAQIALLSSDFAQALRDYRAALTLRPTDFDLQRLFVDTQSRWLQTFERDLEGKSPEEAYQASKAVPAGIDTLLTEPQLGSYRRDVAKATAALKEKLEGELKAAEALHAEGKRAEAYQQIDALKTYSVLLPDLSTRRRALEVNEVHAAMQSAEEEANHQVLADTTAAREELEKIQPLAKDVEGFSELLAKVQREELDELVTAATAAGSGDKPDFKAAFGYLDTAAKLNLPKDEAAKARVALQQLALDHFGIGLVNAIIARDESAVRAALAPLHEFAGLATADGDVKQLIGDSLDYGAFKATLEKLHLNSSPDTSDYRVDVHLVWAALDRFKDAKEARKFIAAAHQSWAHAHEKEKHSAIALALYLESLNWDGEPDDAWEKKLREDVRAKTKLTVAVRTGGEEAAGFDQAALVQKTFERLQHLAAARPNPAWPELTLLGDKKADPNPWQILITCHLSTSDQDSPQITKKSVRYQSGTRSVLNQERQDIIREHNEFLDERNRLVREVNSLKQQSADAQNNPNLSPDQRLSEVTSAEAGALAKNWRINSLENDIASLRAKGEAMPRTVEEPVYLDEEYEDIKHQRTFNAGYWIEAEWNNLDLAPVVQLSDAVKRTTTEVKGNAAHNVPVKAESKIDRAKVASQLTKSLANKIDESALLNLPEISWQYVLARIGKENLGGVDQLELGFSVAFQWQDQGITLDGLSVGMDGLRNAYFPKEVGQADGKR